MKKENAIALATGARTALSARWEDPLFRADKADRAPTIRKFRIVQSEGNREVERLMDQNNKGKA